MTPPVYSPLRGHAVERGRGAEIDHDDRALVTLERRDRVDDPVRPELARVVGEDLDAALDPGLDLERNMSKCSFDQLDHRLVQLRHDAPHDRGGHALARDPVHREQRMQTDAVLVGGASAGALHAELMEELRAVEEAEDDVGVADVDDEEHGGRSSCLPAFRGALPSRSRAPM